MTHLLILAVRLMGMLPLPVLQAVGFLLGWALSQASTKPARVTAINLSRCLPELSDADRQRLAKRSLGHSAAALTEAPAIWTAPATRRKRWLVDDTHVQQRMTDLLSTGRGAIFLTPHQGAWELTSYFAARIAPITVLYKPQKGRSDAVLRWARTREPAISAVATTASGVKSLLAALKRGEMIGILPDHDPPPETGTRFAPLFGIPANTMDLVSKLAGRTGAPVAYVIAERLPVGRGFRMHLIDAPPDIDDPDRGPAALNAGLETCIRRLPEQYWWSYQRYRRQPPGTPPFYADAQPRP